MSVRQVTISVTTEGRGDLHVLPLLVERAAFDVIRQQTHLDVDILPPFQSNRPSGARFQAWMARVERRQRADVFVVHQDADSDDSMHVVDGRWKSWLERAEEPKRWVIAVPVPTTEAWMIADHENLAATLGLPHPHVVERIGRSTRTDSVRRPKRVVAALVGRSEATHGWRLRHGTVGSTWAARASLRRLTQRSASYAEFAGRLSESLLATLLGSREP